MEERHRSTWPVWALPAGLLAGGMPMGAQVPPNVRMIQDGCPACRIEIDTLVRITDPTGEGGLARGPVSRDAEGRWLVASGATPGLIAIYDSSGQFMRFEGGAGDGPGEYRSIAGMVPSSDGSLRVFDMFARRITRLDPAFEVRSTSLLESLLLSDVVALPDGGEVVLASSSHPRSIGYPLHRLERGEVVLSFGAANPDYRRDKRWLSRRRLSYSQEHGLWTSETHRYRLERWDPQTGAVLDRVQRDAGWLPFMEPPNRLDIEGDTPPNGGVAGLFVDRDNLAWVMLRIPDQSWQEGIGAGKDPYGRPTTVLTDANLVWNTVIEVVDLDAGVALARVQFDRVIPGYAWGVDGRAMPVLYDETDLGFPSVTVVGLSVVRGPN